MFTRRSVLTAPLALVVAQSCATPTVSAHPGARTRYGVNAPEARPHLDALARAIRKMKSPSAQPLLSWDKQREIHSGHWRHHWTWRFLPWHRTQLACFEAIVRRLSGFEAYAQPYWDPNDHKTLPDFFFDETSPFYLDGRADGLKGLDFTAEFARLVAAGEYKYATLGSFDFLGLAGQADEPGAIDAGIHGLVHVMIGGEMGDPATATLDPVFWFHHCNVDRMWATWQDQNDAYNAGKYPAEFLAESFDGIFALPSGETFKGGAAAVVDHRTVFAYDKLYSAPIVAVESGAPPPPPRGETAPPTAPSRLEFIGAATTTLASLAPGSATATSAARLSVPVPAAVRPVSAMRRRVEINRAVATVMIRGEAGREVALRVSLVEPGYVGTPPAGDPRVGELVSLFGAFHHMDMAHFAVNLTRQFRAAFAHGAQEDVQIIVELVRFQPASSTEVTIETVALDVTASTYGVPR